MALLFEQLTGCAQPYIENESSRRESVSDLSFSVRTVREVFISRTKSVREKLLSAMWAFTQAMACRRNCSSIEV